MDKPHFNLKPDSCAQSPASPTLESASCAAGKAAGRAALFEGWLKRRPLRAAGDFAERTLARLHAESQNGSLPSFAESQAEIFLGDFPVCASENFVPKTMERLHRTREAPLLLRFRAWGWAAGAAAALLLGLFFSFHANAPSGDTVLSANAGEYVASYEVDDILLLAEPLAQAQAPLDEKSIDALTILASLSI